MTVPGALDVGGLASPADLPAPVRARSIMVGTHQLLVEELNTGALSTPQPLPPALSPSVVLYGFVDVDAVPYLVSIGGDDLRPGPVLGVATGLDEQLGELHVTGELGEWIYPASDIRVADVLQQHLDCMIEPVRGSLELLRLKVAPIRLSRIWTRPPGAEAPLVVDLDSFEGAEPDPWAAFATDAARHLNEQHHDDLLALARNSGARGCTAVSLTRLDAGGAILTAMSHEGLMDVVIPFDPPAASPGEASRRLTGKC
jgi:uncharacterized protein DUF2470